VSPYPNVFFGVLLFVPVTLSATLLTRWVMLYARRRLLDLPNERSSHARPTPRGGGLAIVLTFSLTLVGLFWEGLLPLRLAMALAGLLPLAAIGFVDDHGHVPARWRFLVQALVSVWALSWVGGMDTLELAGAVYVIGWFGNLVAILFMLWMLNLFNFMDGIDGIAGTETVTVSLSGAVLMYLAPGADCPPEGLVLQALAAATCGFLVWNWPPAKIFMGDVGSGVLGFLLALLALWSAREQSLSLAAWIILGAVFMVDATLTLLIRIRRGERWYEAHCCHAYQQAARRLGSHRKVTLSVLAINLAWLLPLAWLATMHAEWELELLLIALLPICFTAYRLGAGRH
jgi:Fuc2NAc and GlcNAc transferase